MVRHTIIIPRKRMTSRTLDRCSLGCNKDDEIDHDIVLDSLHRFFGKFT